VVTTPPVTVAPPTATVPNVPPPPPISVAPVVSNPPKVSPPKASPPKAGPTVVALPVTPKGNTSPSQNKPSGSGGSSGSGGGRGPVSGVVNTVKQSLPAVNRGGGIVAKPAPGQAGTVGGGYTTPGSGNPSVSPVFGDTPGGPGGGGFSGMSGFGGPGFGPGAGGPGTPAAFALGIQRGTRGTVTGNGSGGVTAFAAAVGSLAGCFYALTPFEQQVLTVRSGIDGHQALTRGQLAALLGTSPGAIGATERSALGQLRSAAQTDGCMPVRAAGPANAPTAFIGGPFGPVGYVTPAVPPPSRAAPGSNAEIRLANTSFADQLATLENAGGQASMSVLVILAVMLSGALAALLLEARRSVH
jgi:hypothetical protein